MTWLGIFNRSHFEAPIENSEISPNEYIRLKWPRHNMSLFVIEKEMKQWNKLCCAELRILTLSPVENGILI